MSYLNTPGVEWIHTTEATVVASIFSTISIIISIIHIMQHLSHYTMPGIQIYVIRILIICPVYAISSALAVGLGKNGQYAEVARDVYEAFVIYSFLNLILEYCGGETDCVYQIENEPLLKMPCPLCFMKPKQRDARLIRTLKRGVLQFVIIKPIFAVIDIVMIATGEYYNLPYQFFEMFVYNISYTWALYCMYLFYIATNKIIKKFRPILKFASVKMIVFATYYQSLLVKASSMSPENAIMWNDLLLCIEMVVFASILMLAFPTSEFQGGLPDSRLMNNVKDVLKIKDVVQDVYHNFMPVYQEYTLQRSEKEAPETVRVKTYLAGNLDSVAIEMSHRYRGRNKRFAFNTLLRGDTPIRAHLRSRSTHFDEQVAGQGDSGVGGAGRENRSVLESDSEWDDSDALLLKAANGTSNDDLPSSSETVEEDSLYEKFMARQQENQWLQMFTSAGERARAHCQSRSSDSSDPDDDLSTSSDCLTANIRLSHVSLDKNQDMDIETGMMMSNNKPNILFQQLNPIEMDIYQRRINFMKTHGIGMIVTDHGVEVRPASFCPTEEEGVINVEFMNKELHKLAHFSITTSASYVLPAENVAAAVLPRITSSKKKDKEAKAHQKRVETAVRKEEELLLQASVRERMTPPVTSTSGPNNLSPPSRTPPSSSDNLTNLTALAVAGNETDEKVGISDVQRQQQQAQLDKIKLLPPIMAISAPRKVSSVPKIVKKIASALQTKNTRGNIPLDEEDEGGGQCKWERKHVEEQEKDRYLGTRARAISDEGSDDWGDFQVNEASRHVSPEKDFSGGRDQSPDIENNDANADIKVCNGNNGNDTDEDAIIISVKKDISRSGGVGSIGSDSNSTPSTVTNPMLLAVQQEHDKEDGQDQRACEDNNCNVGEMTTREAETAVTGV